MAAINLAKAVLLREAEESQTIFGSTDNMLKALIEAIDSPCNISGSSFEQLRALAIKNGFVLKHSSQLNSAALRRFLEWGEPAMAILAAEIMQDCGVHTKLEVGELKFVPEEQYRDDRIYAFSERKLLVKAIGDEDFGVVACWHLEAYWQEWHRDLWHGDLTKWPFNPNAAEKLSEEQRSAWNTQVGYSSYVHWPRIEKTNMLDQVLRILNVYDPPLELPERPPQLSCSSL